MKKNLFILLIALMSVEQVFAQGTATINIRCLGSGMWNVSGLVKQFIECNGVLIGTIEPENCISLRVPVGNVMIKDYYACAEVSNLYIVNAKAKEALNKTYEQLKARLQPYQYAKHEDSEGNVRIVVNYGKQPSDRLTYKDALKKHIFK